MSDLIDIVLPDGSTRECRGGHDGRRSGRRRSGRGSDASGDRCRRRSRARPRAAVARRGQGRDRRPASRRGRYTSAPLDRPRAGPGGARPVPWRQVRHRPADRGRLLLRLRPARRRARSARTTSSASRPGCARSSPRSSRSSARSITRGRGGEAVRRPALQASRSSRAGRRSDGGRRAAASCSVYRQPARRFVDLCRGPHVPAHRTARPLQAHEGRGRLLAGRRDATRCCSASTAPRGSRSRRSKEHLHRLEEAEKRDHRKLGVELDLFHFPPELGGGLPVCHPKGGIVRKLMEDYCRAEHERGRLRVRLHAAHRQVDAVRDVRAPPAGTPTACTRPWRWRARRTTRSP